MCRPPWTKRNKSPVVGFTTSIRIIRVNHGDVSRRALGRFLAPDHIAFRHGPRCVYGPPTSSQLVSRISFFSPPLFSRSYSPLHCTALPSLYFSLHLHFITSRFFLPPYLVHESIRFHMRWLWANLLKRLMLEVSGEYFKLSCFFFIISDSYLFYVSLFQIIIRRRIASILKFSIIIIRVRKILSLVLLNF